MFEHPKTVCMSYIAHCCFALRLSGYLFYAGTCSLIHAFYPDAFQTTTSDIIKFLDHKIETSGCRSSDKK